MLRSLVWRFPRISWRLIALQGDPPSRQGFDFWIGGVPHSGQSALQDLLERAFHGRRVVGKVQTPSSIIRALYQGPPGVVTITSPRDKAVAWAAASGRLVQHCLDDYIDSYGLLWPYRSQLLVIRREDVATDPVAVVQRLERWFSLPPTFFERNGDRESDDQPADRESDELLRQLSHEIDRSLALRRKLRKAERLYRDYADAVGGENQPSTL